MLKWVGAADLLRLAWTIANSGSDSAVPATKTSGYPFGFLQAALFQWVNPKAWIIAAGALATCTAQVEAAPLAAPLLLAILLGRTTLPCSSLWALIGVGTARVLTTRRGLRLFNLAMAGLLVASPVPTLRE